MMQSEFKFLKKILHCGKIYKVKVDWSKAGMTPE